MISPEIIKEFQIALKDEYGKDVTFEDASLILNDLTGYFDTLSKIYHNMQTRAENANIVMPD